MKELNGRLRVNKMQRSRLKKRKVVELPWKCKNDYREWTHNLLQSRVNIL